MTTPLTTRIGATVLATLVATAAVAQAPGLTTLDQVEFPALEDFQTDQQVIDSLSGQGYRNLVIIRGDDVIVVTGERGGVPTEMIFSAIDGSLLVVDGVEPEGDGG